MSSNLFNALESQCLLFIAVELHRKSNNITQGSLRTSNSSSHYLSGLYAFGTLSFLFSVLPLSSRRIATIK